MSAPATDARPAGLHWRLLAMLYDLLPLAALWFAGSALFLLLRGGEPVAPGSLPAWALAAWLLALGFGYFGLSWRRGGQTIGMRAWRLRLVGADGRVPGWPQLALRYLVAIVSMAAFGLGFLWALVEPRCRAWHDLAAGTELLRLPRPPRP